MKLKGFLILLAVLAVLALLSKLFVYFVIFAIGVMAALGFDWFIASPVSKNYNGKDPTTIIVVLICSGLLLWYSWPHFLALAIGFVLPKFRPISVGIRPVSE